MSSLFRIMRFYIMSVLVLLIVGCWPLQQEDERRFVLYFDMQPEKTATVVKPPPTKKKLGTAQPKVSPNERLRDKMQSRYNQLVKNLQQRSILIEDLADGDNRLQRIRKYMQAKDFQTTASLLRSLEQDLERVKIDEEFITKKNARLLSLLQVIKPKGTVLEQIDRESEEINLLLEQADYEAINRRMNRLFELLRQVQQ